MFQLSAPYPLLQTVTLLPNPRFSDSEALMVSVARKTAVDGTRYTYVKRKDQRRKLIWAFTMTRNKALELRAFVYSYYASKVKVIDHNDRVWVGNLMNNPFEFDTTGRAAPAIAPLSRGENVNIEIEFEGVEQ